MKFNSIPHPAAFLNKSLTDTISRYAAEAEQMTRLHPEQLALIYKQKWFNLFVPKAFGGLQLSLTEGLKIEECIAWADGSTGWTVTLCSGANFFIGFMHPDTTKMLFNKAEVCLAGSGRNAGIAKDIGEEFEITGYWNYATGGADATAFTANCIVEKNGFTVQNDHASPTVISMVFLREEIILHTNWKSIGMIATASNGFEVKNLRIKKSRCFVINESATVLSELIYKYPFMHFAEATLAVNNSGMAVRFIDLCHTQVLNRIAEKNILENTGNYFLMLIEKATQQLQAARQLFYITIQLSWDEFIQDNTFSAGTLQQVSATSKELAATARRLVDELYPYCGLTAANPATEINRVWRNLHTASQHPLLLSAD